MPRRPFLVGSALVLLAALLACRSSPEPPPDVVLVVLDTLRRDATALEGSRTSTPVLDRLVREGTAFPRAWATAPWTVPSHGSIFTGTLPSIHGATSRDPRLRSVPTLAERLRDSGYRTAAFFANPWLSDDLSGLLRGFDERNFLPGTGGPDQGGRAIVAEMEGWLAEARGDRPLFLFVNLLEPHAPYDPPLEFRARSGATPAAEISTDWILDYQAGLVPPESVDWGEVRRLYLGDVRFVDSLLGRLLEILDGPRMSANDVLIVTSDHGEHLGEQGLVEHQFRLDDTLLAVPLVIRAPGRLEPGRREEPVILTDLFATVLELAGQEPGPSLPHSRSLVDAGGDSRPRPLLSEYSGPPSTLLRHLRGRNPELDVTSLTRSYRSVRLGDLRLTVDDRGNRTVDDGLRATSPEASGAERDGVAVSRLLQILRRELGGAPVAPGDAELELSEENRRRLRALGYVE